jgi:uncharacterized protein YpmS
MFYNAVNSNWKVSLLIILPLYLLTAILAISFILSSWEIESLYNTSRTVRGLPSPSFKVLFCDRF